MAKTLWKQWWQICGAIAGLKRMPSSDLAYSTSGDGAKLAIRVYITKAAIGRPKGGMSQRGCEMRRCVLCGRWLLLAFQVEGGSLCVRRRVSGWGGVGE